MKTLTDLQLIRLCAEMDGYTQDEKPDFHSNFWLRKDGKEIGGDCEPNPINTLSHLLPKYLTSYDAIIPLIVKWCGDNAVYKGRFIGCLFQVLGSNVPPSWYCELPIGSLTAFALIEATPRQLTIALRSAAGKAMGKELA